MHVFLSVLLMSLICLSAQSRADDTLDFQLDEMPQLSIPPDAGPVESIVINNGKTFETRHLANGSLIIVQKSSSGEIEQIIQDKKVSVSETANHKESKNFFLGLGVAVYHAELTNQIATGIDTGRVYDLSNRTVELTSPAYYADGSILIPGQQVVSVGSTIGITTFSTQNTGTFVVGMYYTPYVDAALPSIKGLHLHLGAQQTVVVHPTIPVTPSEAGRLATSKTVAARIYLSPKDQKERWGVTVGPHMKSLIIEFGWIR